MPCPVIFCNSFIADAVTGSGKRCFCQNKRKMFFWVCRTSPPQSCAKGTLQWVSWLAHRPPARLLSPRANGIRAFVRAYSRGKTAPDLHRLPRAAGPPLQVLSVCGAYYISKPDKSKGKNGKSQRSFPPCRPLPRPRPKSRSHRACPPLKRVSIRRMMA